MDYQMIDDKVLVEVAKSSEEQTDAGIIMPVSAQAPKNEGTVVAVGPGRTMSSGDIKPAVVQVGDVVLFVPEMCVELEIDGVKHMVARESDILAIQK